MDAEGAALVDDCARQAGSERKLAYELGVDPSTVNQWGWIRPVPLPWRFVLRAYLAGAYPDPAALSRSPPETATQHVEERTDMDEVVEWQECWQLLLGLRRMRRTHRAQYERLRAEIAEHLPGLKDVTARGGS